MRKSRIIKWITLHLVSVCALSLAANSQEHGATGSSGGDPHELFFQAQIKRAIRELKQLGLTQTHSHATESRARDLLFYITLQPPINTKVEYFPEEHYFANCSFVEINNRTLSLKLSKRLYLEKSFQEIRYCIAMSLIKDSPFIEKNNSINLVSDSLLLGAFIKMHFVPEVYFQTFVRLKSIVIEDNETLTKKLKELSYRVDRVLRPTIDVRNPTLDAINHSIANLKVELVENDLKTSIFNTLRPLAINFDSQRLYVNKNSVAFHYFPSDYFEAALFHELVSFHRLEKTNDYSYTLEHFPFYDNPDPWVSITDPQILTPAAWVIPESVRTFQDLRICVINNRDYYLDQSALCPAMD